MRSTGSASVLEYRRQLAVERLVQGYSTAEVAEFLDVDPRTVRRWIAEYRRGGWDALASRPVLGRPSILTRCQEKIVRCWLSESPTEFGFANELWTAARVTQLIREEWGLLVHPRSVRRWLRQHHFSPQKPLVIPRERDPDALTRWLTCDWPRLKKSPQGRRDPGFYR